MIVIDTSAIIAVILNEASSQRVSDAIAQSDACTISPVTLTEATMVLSRTVHDPKLVLDSYLHTLGIEICAIDSAQAELARTAFLGYGKGRHPARLNIGDCFSYAAAKALSAPLLYVGEDFAKTDVRAA